jgi:DNA-binding transcriptional LysR family regulator
VYDKHALGSRDILQLIAVADAGSIRRAADALGMTQPGLSKNIRSIEARLGIPVFERSTAGAQLTDNGTLVIERGRQVLIDLQGIVRDVRDQALAEQGIVRIGAGSLAAPLVAKAVATDVFARFPGIAVELVIGNPFKLIGELERGAIDYLIGFAEGLTLPPTVQVRKLVTLYGSFFVRRGHPLAHVEDVSAPRLAEWPLALSNTYPRFLNWYREATGEPNPIVQFLCDDFDRICDVVENTDCVAVASFELVETLRKRRNIVPIRVAGFDFPHDVNFISMTTRPLSRAGTRVLDAITEWLRAN